MVVLAGVANPHAYASGDDRETRSAEVLQELVPSPDGPGRTAAGGVRGSVVPEAGRGKAELKAGRVITSKAVFDVASNSNQFAADTALLPAGRQHLALNDPLSDHLDNPPAWARDVPLGDLMRHTSGIPDHQDLPEAKDIGTTFIQQEFFRSTVKVSPDRNTAVTVVCNAEPPDSFRAANQLPDTWTK
ncbi:serine hydrolase [Streptomyces sp. R11]|uniref:Serine hydrolase n=1 Tax=Streptomyces sp. R11 TaxID=3238625 RepID=A0AB39NDU6_9ACTN